MKLYISGKMTGLPEDNFPAFHEAARLLREAGFEVVNPAELVLPVNTAKTWNNYIRRDIIVLMECGGVAVLDGEQYKDSKGSRLELYNAFELEMPVRYVSTWLEVHLRFREILAQTPKIGRPQQAP